MTFKAIVFDLGGVLIDVRHGGAVQALATRSEISAEALAAAMYASPLFIELESGACDARRFFSEMRTAMRLDLGFDEFCAIYCDLFAPVYDMIGLHARLRASGYRTYVFSNTSALHFDYLRRQYSFMEQFDGYFLSYELRRMKPDERAYEAVEAGTASRGAEILYIDDRAENAAAGARRGWQTIHHIAPRTTLGALRTLGVV